MFVLGWKIYFWLIAALLVLPLPFKLYEYATGRDASPKAVKVEEMLNAVYFWIGLVGLYAYSHGAAIGSNVFWRGWALVAIVLTFVGLAWSPKIRYATDVLGRKRARIAIAVGTVVMLPMLVGVWRAGA